LQVVTTKACSAIAVTRARIKAYRLLKLIQNLLNLNLALAGKVRSVKAYDEALAFHGAKEFTKAIPLMREAAELGNTNAMSVLGSMLLLGQGVKENGKEAEQWLKRAVDAGNAQAVSVLGMAYAIGKAGCPRDLSRGRVLLAQAAEAGDEQSARMLEMMDKKVGIFKRK
jgi:TPR repeat protein